MLPSHHHNDSTSLRSYLADALILRRGLRPREVQNINWSDIDLSNGILHIGGGMGCKARQITLSKAMVAKFGALRRTVPGDRRRPFASGAGGHGASGMLLPQRRVTDTAHYDPEVIAALAGCSPSVPIDVYTRPTRLPGWVCPEKCGRSTARWRAFPAAPLNSDPTGTEPEISDVLF